MDNTAKEEYLECEKPWVFWTLILVGGIYGAYTFIQRGGIFCNAQTANIVLFGMAVGQLNRAKIIHYLIPICAYLLGTILSEILAKYVKRFKLLRWDTILIGFEIPVVLVLGFLPADAPDQICQISLNFVCAMQFNTFRQVEGVPCATTFVTNHVRQVGSNLVKMLRDRDRKAGRRFYLHGSMLLFFLTGVIISTICCRFFGYRAIWSAAVFLVAAFARLCFVDLKKERDRITVTPHGH